MFKIQEWLMQNNFDFKVIVDGPHMTIELEEKSIVMIIENDPDELIHVSVNKLSPVLIYSGLSLKKIKKSIKLAYNL